MSSYPYAAGSDQHRAALQAAALDFANRGWPVFPCLPGRKLPATKRGFRDAMLDPDEIAVWWSRTPFNVGIATGGPGPDVLDIDSKSNGFTAYNRLKRRGLLDGSHMIVKTRSGGIHLYYEGSEQRCRARIGRTGVDFRAVGGYVLAAPSYVDEDGVAGFYSLISERPATGQLIDLTAVSRFLDPPVKPAARPASYRKMGSIAGLLRGVQSAPEGARNDYLNWSAYRAARDGLMDAAAIEAFVSAAGAAGLPDAESRRTIASAIRGASK